MKKIFIYKFNKPIKILHYKINKIVIDIFEDIIFYKAPCFVVSLYEFKEDDPILDCSFSLNQLENEKIKKQFLFIKKKCLKSYKMYVLINGL